MAAQFLVRVLLLRDVARDAEQELRLAAHIEDRDLHRVEQARPVTRVHRLLRHVDHRRDSSTARSFSAKKSASSFGNMSWTSLSMNSSRG